jgi:hypothetical protein
MLRERNLKLSGRKSELINRLLEAMTVEERVDVKRFKGLYKALKKSKDRHHHIPRDLSLFYSRLKQ